MIVILIDFYIIDGLSEIQGQQDIRNSVLFLFESFPELVCKCACLVGGVAAVVFTVVAVAVVFVVAIVAVDALVAVLIEAVARP